MPDSDLFSYNREILLCLAGPATNFLCVFIGLHTFGAFPSDFYQYFIFASAALGILNLLPIQGFDGGRILHALLSKHLEPRVVGAWISALSFLFIFLLWSISLYLLIRTASSLSLFIFSLSLFARIFIPER